MRSPPERGAWVREEAWTIASPRGGDGRLAELANLRGAEHTSHSPHRPPPPRPAPCIPALAPSRLSISLSLSLFFIFFLPASGTGWGQQRKPAAWPRGRTCRLQAPRVCPVLSPSLRASTAGWRPSSPHLHLPSPPKVLEIETDAGLKKKKKKSKK